MGLLLVRDRVLVSIPGLIGIHGKANRKEDQKAAEMIEKKQKIVLSDRRIDRHRRNQECP